MVKGCCTPIQILFPAGMQAAAASSGQPNAWKSKRRCTEWRVRWLELRLRELKYQQSRYQQQLDRLTSSSKPPAAGGVAAPALGMEVGSDLAKGAPHALEVIYIKRSRPNFPLP